MWCEGVSPAVGARTFVVSPGFAGSSGIVRPSASCGVVRRRSTSARQNRPGASHGERRPPGRIGQGRPTASDVRPAFRVCPPGEELVRPANPPSQSARRWCRKRQVEFARGISRLLAGWDRVWRFRYILRCRRIPRAIGGTTAGRQSADRPSPQLSATRVSQDRRARRLAVDRRPAGV